jgi:hypothetical protein
MTATEVTPTDGLLAAGGTANLHAIVHCGPVPRSAPPAFADVSEPIRGEDGETKDWRLTTAASTDQRIAFAQWRSNFITERILGDVASVRSFIRWADHHLDISAIHVLTLGACQLEPSSLARAEFQARRAEELLRQRGETGLGITSPQRHGLLRGFALDDQPVLLLAGGGASISAVRDGIEVRQDGRTAVITQWHVQDGQVTARTADGQEVSYGGSAAARLLCRLAPVVEDAQATTVPLATIYAGLLLHLRDLCHVAGTDQVPLMVTTHH